MNNGVHVTESSFQNVITENNEFVIDSLEDVPHFSHSMCGNCCQSVVLLYRKHVHLTHSLCSTCQLRGIKLRECHLLGEILVVSFDDLMKLHRTKQLTRMQDNMMVGPQIGQQQSCRFLVGSGRHADHDDIPVFHRMRGISDCCQLACPTVEAWVTFYLDDIAIVNDQLQL